MIAFPILFTVVFGLTAVISGYLALLWNRIEHRPNPKITKQDTIAMLAGYFGFASVLLTFAYLRDELTVSAFATAVGTSLAFGATLIFLLKTKRPFPNSRLFEVITCLTSIYIVVVVWSRYLDH